MEGDEFVNENFIRGFPELRKNIIKKKVSAQVMQSLLLIIALIVRSVKVRIVTELTKAPNFAQR